MHNQQDTLRGNSALKSPKSKRGQRYNDNTKHHHQRRLSQNSLNNPTAEIIVKQDNVTVAAAAANHQVIRVQAVEHMTPFVVSARNTAISKQFAGQLQPNLCAVLITRPCRHSTRFSSTPSTLHTNLLGI